MFRAAILAAVLAVAVAAPLVLVGLGRAPFDDPGEGMHAEIARELWLTRTPFALTLSGVRYVDKPPLLHSLIAVAYAWLGQSEWSARLPAALAGLVAIGATAWLGARLAGIRGGLLAGLALATSVGFFAYARLAGGSATRRSGPPVPRPGSSPLASTQTDAAHCRRGTSHCLHPGTARFAVAPVSSRGYGRAAFRRSAG